MKHILRKRCLATALGSLLSVVLPAFPQTMTWKEASQIKDESFFKTAEAQRIGDFLLCYQRCTGGWPKNIDMARPLDEEEKAAVLKDKTREDDSTTDNNATTRQITFLANLYRNIGGKRYYDAVRKGLEYLLNGQYANGGWPQFWPKMRDYQVHITYNDGAMVNTMRLIGDAAKGKKPFDGDIVDSVIGKRLAYAFQKGIDCILNTQIVVNGQPTVWCQQHDRETLRPAKARAYELPSFCSTESAEIVRLLMSLPNPDERVKKAVRGAMLWFDKYKLTGLRIVRARTDDGGNDTRLIADSHADTPLWARFYDLEKCEPFVCDRDGVPRQRLKDIGEERRNGYCWYSDRPSILYKQYEKWAAKYDKTDMLPLELNSKGANENGVIDWSQYE